MPDQIQRNFLGAKIKFYEGLQDRGFRRCKLTPLFNKVKYSERLKLLSPTISLNISELQKIPEHLLEKDVTFIWDQFMVVMLDVSTQMSVRTRG